MAYITELWRRLKAGVRLEDQGAVRRQKGVLPSQGVTVGGCQKKPGGTARSDARDFDIKITKKDYTLYTRWPVAYPL